mgnify:FL=1
MLPVLSIFVNVYLMMQMSSVTWAQCGIWNAMGEWPSGMKRPLEGQNPTPFLTTSPHKLCQMP